MQKFLIFLILFFPIVVFAEDKTVINSYETTISQTSNNEFIHSEIHNIKNIFGDPPSINYFNKKIELKNKFYNVNVKMFEVSSEHYYGVSFENSEYYEANVGTALELMNEDETIVLSYVKEFENHSLYNDEIIIIAKSDYEIKNTNFNLFLEDDLLYRKVLFSLDNKNYYPKLDNLTFEIDEENKMIKGEYRKIINNNQALYVKFVSDKVYVADREIITYLFLGLMLITFFAGMMYYLKSLKNKTS